MRRARDHDPTCRPSRRPLRAEAARLRTHHLWPQALRRRFAFSSRSSSRAVYSLSRLEYAAGGDLKGAAKLANREATRSGVALSSTVGEFFGGSTRRIRD